MATRYTVSQAANLKLGQGGWDIVTNATVNSHTYIAITMLVGTEVIADNTASGTVTAVTVDANLGDSLSSLEVPVGTTIYGRWDSIKLNDDASAAIVYFGY